MSGENLIPAMTTTVATAATIMPAADPNTSVTASSTAEVVIALPAVRSFAVPMAPSSNYANLAFASASGVIKDNKKVPTEFLAAPSPNYADVQASARRTSGVKNNNKKQAAPTDVVLALPAFTGSAGRPVTSSSINARVKKNKKAPSTEANLASSNVHVTISASRSRTVKNEKKAPAEVILALPAFTSHAAPPSSSKANVTSASSTSGVKDNKKPRGKIRMEKMDKESNLMVTFSKRKSGLIKKANELCTLCGVQCAVVVFSPAGKPFSFGHPSVDEVVNRYLMGNPNPIYAPQGNYDQVVPQNAIVEANQPDGSVIAENLSKELKDLAAIFEAAKKHGQVVDERRKARMADCWWERPVQELNVCQLGVLRQAMEDLKSKVYDVARAASSSGPSTLLGPSTNALSDDGSFPRWNNNNNYGLHEAGPSGHAAGGLGGSSGGRLGGSSSKRRE